MTPFNKSFIVLVGLLVLTLSFTSFAQGNNSRGNRGGNSQISSMINNMPTEELTENEISKINNIDSLTFKPSVSCEEVGDRIVKKFEQMNEEIGPPIDGVPFKKLENLKVESLEIEDRMGYKYLIVTDETGSKHLIKIDGRP